MKKRIAVFTAIIGLCYIILSGYSGGAAFNSQNCTGSKVSVTSCSGSTGTGCHGTGSGTTCYIRVDSEGGVQVGNYVPGMTYTVTVAGANPLNLPKFGFQFTTVKGSGAGETMAGTYAGFPINVTSNIFNGLRFVEQTQGIDAPVPGVYKQSFQWVAPALPGSGIIKMYLTLLAVNGNNFQDAGDVSSNVSITLLERALGSPLTTLANTSITAFPNPVGNMLHLQVADAQPGMYHVYIYDINGRQVAANSALLSGSLESISFSTADWQPGMYTALIEHDGAARQLSLVKQ